MDEAVETAHMALFTNMGQACTAGSRLFVHESVYDKFVQKAVDMAKARTIGNPYEPTTRNGPQVRPQMEFRRLLT